jgi:hypothetical protein
MVKAGIIREKNMNFKGKATLDDDLVISAIRGNKEALVLCQENGHVKQREIAELRQLLFSG